MDLIIKHYSELTTDDLYEIYKLRVSIFVVEQKCPYHEIDDADRVAYHLWLHNENGIVAYARVLPQGVTFQTASIGRVIAKQRRCGLGRKIVSAAIDVARDKFSADKITIEAQVYAQAFYEKLGFKKISNEYLEDGIPHIQMQLMI